MIKIGMFDSGVGGLANLFGLIDTCPFHYVYVADQLHSPYGSKTNAQLLSYTSVIVRFLISKQCNIIIVACNTVCATVLDQLKIMFPAVQFISVIEPTIQKINESQYENLLLIATEATVKSGAYLKNNHKKMEVLATPLFVPAIESLDYEKIDLYIDQYLHHYRNKIDCIVLGCTHYPLIADKIQKYLNVDVIHAIPLLKDLLPTEKATLVLEIYTTKDACVLQHQTETLFHIKTNVKLLEVFDESHHHVG